MVSVLSFDIGGSSIKSALIGVAAGRARVIEDYGAHPLPEPEFGIVRDELRRRTRSCTADIDAIAISTAGAVDPEGVVLSAGNLRGYRNVSWASELEGCRPPQVPLLVTNDGRASTWAEFSLQPTEVRHFAHVVLGTGVGGATVVDGRLVQGDRMFAGNLGHLRLQGRGAVACVCGSWHCLESHASARAIAARYTRGSSRDAFAATVRQAEKGNKAAIASFVEAGEAVGRVMAILMNLLNPSAITVGGGVMLASAGIAVLTGHDPLLSAAVEQAQVEAHQRVSGDVRISPGDFGNHAGLAGAALLAADLYQQTGRGA